MDCGLRVPRRPQPTKVTDMSLHEIGRRIRRMIRVRHVWSRVVLFCLLRCDLGTLHGVCSGFGNGFFSSFAAAYAPVFEARSP